MTSPEASFLRPPERYIKRFKASMCGDDTIETYLRQGTSLAIMCRCCPRVTIWTPPELEQRFGGKLSVRIADLVPRLSCKGEDGCGSTDVAVGPEDYAEGWSWSRSRLEQIGGRSDRANVASMNDADPAL